MLFRVVFLLSCLVCLTPAAFGWGGEGHRYVALLAVDSLPGSPLKQLLQKNADWFAEASSYPDRWRNRPDAAEAPRHFLDGENFGGGTDLSRIPRGFKEVQQVRNYQELRTDGVVPWTVGRHYALLVRAFRDRRMDDALMQAAYLSHYIADSHVPFHASANYDGQLSQPSQKGIHARFESILLERSVKRDDLKAGEPARVDDPVEFTFTTLQDSINQVATILAADKEAVTASGGKYDDMYWQSFTLKARPIAIQRLEIGGRALAGLLQKAWEDAGKPAIPTDVTASYRLFPYAPAFTPRGQTPPPFLPQFSDADKEGARGRVRTINVASPSWGGMIPVNVILPADYATSGRRYGVLYLLHGATGSYRDWNNLTGIAAYAEKRPFIVVMPDAGGASWYTNSLLQGRVADFIAKDLPSAIDRQFRTIARKNGRAIAGLSMGGYGAWKLALDNPETFGTAASLSGAFFFGQGDPAETRTERWRISVFGTATPDVETYRRASLWPRLLKLQKDGGWIGPALYFDSGSEDTNILSANREMEAFLLEQRIPYEFSEFKGGHTWTYWDEHILDVLQFVERHIAPPQ